MLKREKLRRADVVASLALMLLGIAVVIGALGMPLSGTYGGRPVHWYTSPAFFPLLLGSLLVLLSAVVLLRSLREGGHRGLLGAIRRGAAVLPGSRETRRIVAIWFYLGAYILCLSLHPFAFAAGLLARVRGLDTRLTGFLLEPEGANYVLSSFLFLTLFLLTFFRAGRASARWRRVLFILLLALLVSWGVGYVFTVHLNTPLPWLDHGF